MENTEKPSWARHLTRFIVWFVAGALVALGIVMLAERADAADTECTWTATCPEIKKKHRKAARKFRNEKTGRSDGFPVKRMFKKPRAAKRHFVDQIVAVYKEAAATSAKQGVAFTPASVEIPPEGECQTWRCSARKSYRQLTDHANCVDRDPAVFPPTTQSCKVKDWKAPFTKRQVKRGGEVVFCGGAVILGVFSRGASAPLHRAIAGWGGMNCLWMMWDVD